MADEPETPGTDELILDTPLDAPENEEVENGEADEEEIPSFGDEPEEVQDTDNATIRHLREEVKKARKEAAEAKKSAAQPKIEVGPKPTLWDDGIDGDEDKYDAAMDKWKSEIASVKSAETAQQEAAVAQRKQFEAKLAKVEEEKAALGKADVDEAFETVSAALSDTQLIAAIHAIDDGNTARLFYALSKHPAKLAELAGQTDMIRFVKDVTRLEGQLKMVKRKAPAIDKPERGSGKISKEPANKELEKLEAEAERTGDRTKVIAYRRKIREANA